MQTQPTLAKRRAGCSPCARCTRAILWSAGFIALIAAGERWHTDALAADDPSAQTTGQPIDLGPVLARIREKHLVPAMAAAAVKDGTLAGIGVAGVRQSGQDARVTPDDRWYIGSDARAMTATLAAVLVEHGRISWDSTVTDVLPQVAEVARREYRGTTLAQLLSGRSALPDDPGADSPLWKLVRGAEGSMVERRITVAKIALRQEPTPNPGQREHDSALGYVVAGAMLEAAGGAPFEQLMHDHLFTPLGMHTAGFGPPGTPGALDEPVGHASGFAGRLRPVAPTDPSYDPEVMAPAGTVHCSIADWATFAIFSLRGARGDEDLLISPESFIIIQSDMTRRGRPTMGWNLGARSWAGGAILVHEYEGDWYAAIWIGPAANVAYVVAANRGDNEATLAANEALRAMFSREFVEAE